MSHGGNARAAAVAADYSRGAASSKGGVQGKFTKSSGVETGVSRAQKLLEKSLAGKKSQESGPSGDEQPGVTKRSAQWSPELEAKRKHMQELLEQTPAAAAAPLPEAPPLPAGDLNGKVDLLVERLGQVVIGINNLQEGMSQTVKHQDLKEFHERHSAEIRTFVESKVHPVVEDVVELKSQVLDLTVDAVESFDRIGRLEKKVEQLTKKSKPDDSYKRISFMGLPKLSLDDRVSALRDFMSTKFPKILIKDCSIFYRFDREKKTYEATNTGYVEFSSPAVRDHVIKLIEGDAVQFKCVVGGKTVDVKRTRTKNAADRNAALRKAAELIKEKVGTTNADSVTITGLKPGTGDRGVKFKEIVAFSQPSGSGLGEFLGDFCDLTLPEI